MCVFLCIPRYYSISDKNKVADLKLAMFIASHCAVQGIDHLGELLKSLVKAVFSKMLDCTVLNFLNSYQPSLLQYFDRFDQRYR